MPTTWFLLSQSYKSLQFLIDKISELLTIRGLILNSDKTVIMVFSKTKDILNENILILLVTKIL